MCCSKIESADFQQKFLTAETSIRHVFIRFVQNLDLTFTQRVGALSPPPHPGWGIATSCASVYITRFLFRACHKVNRHTKLNGVSAWVSILPVTRTCDWPITKHLYAPCSDINMQCTKWHKNRSYRRFLFWML